MLIITEEQVRERLPMREAIRLMRETFAALRAGTARNQPRRRMFLSTGSVLHSMGMWYTVLLVVCASAPTSSGTFPCAKPSG